MHPRGDARTQPGRALLGPAGWQEKGGLARRTFEAGAATDGAAEGVTRQRGARILRGRQQPGQGQDPALGGGGRGGRGGGGRRVGGLLRAARPRAGTPADGLCRLRCRLRGLLLSGTRCRQDELGLGIADDDVMTAAGASAGWTQEGPGQDGQCEPCVPNQPALRQPRHHRQNDQPNKSGLSIRTRPHDRRQEKSASLARF